MDGKEKYKDIQLLTAELAGQVQAMQNGELPADELDSMAEKARDLYERIIVIRHLAYERIVKSGGEGNKAEEPKVMPFRINMKQSPISQNQTSLIDVIEELTNGDETVSEDKVESSDNKEVTQTDDELSEETVEDSPENQSTEQEKKAPENTGRQKERAPEELASEKVDKEKPQIKKEPQHIDSVNDLAGVNTEKQETIADRLKKSPIQDLKKAIGLNQKFLFINELFEGDASAYEESIEILNNAVSMAEALKYFDKNLVSDNDWEEDHPSVVDLKELVQRRHV